MLASYLGRRVSVITVEGRLLVGVLHAADQLLNVVLSSCVERELAPADAYYYYSSTSSSSKGTQNDESSNAEEKGMGHALKETSVGVMMIRGSDVVSIGLIDVYEEAKQNIKEWKGFDMPEAVVSSRYY